MTGLGLGAFGIPRRVLRLSINKENSDDGKEDSYERNPGGVSFVFNLSFSELFRVQKNLLLLSKTLFRQEEDSAWVPSASQAESLDCRSTKKTRMTGRRGVRAGGAGEDEGIEKFFARDAIYSRQNPNSSVYFPLTSHIKYIYMWNKKM
jgi:hypothetical protein